MTKIFRVNGMYDTPFTGGKALAALESLGLKVCEKELDCQVFVAQRYKELLPFMLRHGKRKGYLVWTHEPRYDTHFCSIIKNPFGLPDVHVMNVYTGDVYINNFTIWGFCIDQQLKPLTSLDLPGLTNRKIVALMSYVGDRRNPPIKKDNVDLDLIRLRTYIALEGHRKNKVDIYGKGWKKSLSLEDSRMGKWRNRKQEILKDYHFNLCFENTSYDYYCTEKIWDSIKGYCLPIYYGQNSRIYEIFPQDSFLDYCRFETPQALFDYIDNMSETEFISRLNLCIEVFNNFYSKGHDYWSAMYMQMLENIITRLNSITSTLPEA